jgi:NTE family protein
MDEFCYNSTQKIGLVLTGGGARAAYQVGALKAIADIVYRPECGNPFPIITGTSAGAINATAIAAGSLEPAKAVDDLYKVWKNFSVEQVFRADFSGLMKNTGRWVRSIFSNQYHKNNQLGLLDNTPLKELLGRVIQFENIQEAIEQKQLSALSVTASGYSTGQSISFFQGEKSLKSWRRYRRCGTRTAINLDHLLASSAIPLLFPAIKINREFFGDGSVRFLAPLSPAIHLGADKILILGVDPVRSPNNNRPTNVHYPSVADIAGHVLDSVFIDSLDSDIERISRVNKTIKLIPEAVRNLQSNLRPIETLTISPSKDLSLLANKHFHHLPRLLRFFFKRIGIGSGEGSTVLSYLLFDSAYTTELLKLGYSDAMQKQVEIEAFFNQSEKSSLPN